MIELPDEATTADLYNPALDVQTPEEAKEYFEALVQRQMRVWGKSEEEAIGIERSNIGYYVGYFNADTRARVYALYGFGHPFFGTTRPSGYEALSQGVEAAANGVSVITSAMTELSQATKDAARSTAVFGRKYEKAFEDVPNE